MSHTATVSSLPLYNPTFSSSQASSKLYGNAIIDWSKLPTLVLSSTITALSQLGRLEENWDGCGSAKPNPLAIRNAMDLLARMHSQVEPISIATGTPWMPPHVSASEDGEVVFEWWKGSHKLTIYITAAQTEYVQVWGPNIATEMTDGVLNGSQFQGLWLWLNA